MSDTPGLSIRFVRARTGVCLLISAGIALGIMASRPARAGTCPSSMVYLTSYHPSTPFEVDTPAYDTTFVDVWTAHMAFDRTQGRMTLSASSSGALWAWARVVERFEVVGVEPGTRLNATMEFHLDGWSEQNCGGSGCGVRLEGTLVAGGASAKGDADQIGPGCQRVNLATTLALPIELMAGSPFESQFLLEYLTGPGGGGAHGECTASYTVSGLPAGARVVACGAAEQTSARGDTWGGLKIRYR